MEFDKFIVAILIVILFVIGGMMIIADQADKYKYSYSNETLGNFSNNLADITTHSNRIINNTKNDVNFLSQWEWYLVGGYNALMIVKDIFGVFGDMTGKVAQMIGIPVEIQAIFLTILVVMIGFTLVFMFFRYQTR